MINSENMNSFISRCKDRGMSDETLRAYRNDLVRLYQLTPPSGTWASFDLLLGQYVARLREDVKPRTFQRHCSSIRMWAKYMGHPVLEDYRMPKIGKPQPHPIKEGIDGVARMIAASDRRNKRDKALCALTGYLGLRVHEATGVRPEDFDLEEMVLTVRGKGDKTRYVPLTSKVMNYIAPAMSDAIVNKTTVVNLSTGGARGAITKLAKRAGLASHVSSHDMRATFATAAYGVSHDIRAVQELLGHANVNTTQVYTGVTRDAMRTAAAVI